MCVGVFFLKNGFGFFENIIVSKEVIIDILKILKKKKIGGVGN